MAAMDTIYRAEDHRGQGDCCQKPMARRSSSGKAGRDEDHQLGAEVPTSMNQLRHISAPNRTTIRLEPAFWSAIDGLAAANGTHWRELVRKMLAAKPEGQAATSWLRVCCLNWSREV